MNIALWVIQVLLGLALIGAGLLKISQPIDKLAPQMTFVKVFPSSFVRFIGIAELLGGVGLIVPGLTGILSWLTPLAGIGIAIIMIGAVGYHFRYNERQRSSGPLVLLLLALVVVIGRIAIAPF